jgi:hypothetical protein
VNTFSGTAPRAVQNFGPAIALLYNQFLRATLFPQLVIPDNSEKAKIAPLAQLDRASDYESEGREFESLRARHSFQGLTAGNWNLNSD